MLHLVAGEWSASRPGRFIPEEIAPGVHWIGGWVEPRAGLYELEERKFFNPTGTRNSNLSVVQPVASRYTDYAVSP
jgi:hypothetical protein